MALLDLIDWIGVYVISAIVQSLNGGSRKQWVLSTPYLLYKDLSGYVCEFVSLLMINRGGGAVG